VNRTHVDYQKHVICLVSNQRGQRADPPKANAGLPSREPHRRQAAQRLRPAWPSGLVGDPSVQIGEE